MTMPQLCEWCLADSGRFNASRQCCIVRGLAKCPPDRRKAHYERVKKEDGKDAANDLIAAVNAERKRLQGLREKTKKPGGDLFG